MHMISWFFFLCEHIHDLYVALQWLPSMLITSHWDEQLLTNHVFYLDGQEGKDFNIYSCSTDVASNDRCLEKEKDVNLEKERISYGPIDERERMRTEHPEWKYPEVEDSIESDIEDL